MRMHSPSPGRFDAPVEGDERRPLLQVRGRLRRRASRPGSTTPERQAGASAGSALDIGRKVEAMRKAPTPIAQEPI